MHRIHAIEGLIPETEPYAVLPYMLLLQFTQACKDSIMHSVQTGGKSETDWIFAFLGAVGALLLRSLLKLFYIWKFGRSLIHQYDCYESGTIKGKLRHSFGHEVSDADANAASKKAWEWSDIKVKDSEGDCTIYGPYVNDFGKPGNYKVIFRIKGNNIANDAEICLRLDVMMNESVFDPVRAQQFRGQTTIVERSVMRREIFSHIDKYKEYELEFYIPGHGEYEYRCTVVKDAIEGATLRFDTVQVRKNMPFNEALQ